MGSAGLRVQVSKEGRLGQTNGILIAVHLCNIMSGELEERKVYEIFCKINSPRPRILREVLTLSRGLLSDCFSLLQVCERQGLLALLAH